MIAELYSRLKQLNITINSVNGQLDIKAPKGIINNELLEEIRLHKEDLIDFINVYSKKKEGFISIPQVGDQADYPLSSSQRRLWVLSRFEEANVAYNIPGVYELQGALDVEVLGNVFKELIARHEILRTVFRQNSGGEVRQQVLQVNETGFRLGYYDMRGGKGSAELLRTLIREECMLGFSLSDGPLLRATVYRLSDEQWILSYVLHHIISDGWSMGILISELLQLYNSRIQGEIESPLRSLGIQYKDYAAWEQEQLEKGLSEAASYWLNTFAGELPVLELHSDKIRPGIKTYNGSIVKREVSEKISSGLKNLGQTTGTTLFMNLLGALNVLLYKYTGQKDIVIGSPIAGRDHADLSDQIGFYVNTLALRLQFNDAESYQQLLSRVKEVTLGAYKHQVYPFDELVDKLDLRIDMSRNPLFDVVLVLQNAETNNKSGHQVTLGNLISKSYESPDSEVSKFDLTFDVTETFDGLNLSIIYNTDLFYPETIEKMADHLVNLLGEIVQNPSVPVRQLNYMPPTQREELLHKLEHAAVGAYDGTDTLVSMFERMAHAHGNREALVAGDCRLSYAELNELSNQLAYYLREAKGVDRGDLVGLMTERNEWMIIGILGILKSGAGYVPVDTSYPADRVEYIVEDSGIKLLLDEEEFSRFRLVQDDYNTSNNRVAHKSSDCAYVIYTSGTTGRPKGVMISHGNVVSLLKSGQTLFDFTEKDVWTLFHSYSFDFSVWEMYGSLLSGGKLVVLPLTVVQDPLQLMAVLTTEGVTVLNQTPSSFYQLQQAAMEQGAGYTHKVRYVIFGGERLSPGRLRYWKDTYPVTKLVNMYGITETTVHVTYKEIGEPELLTDLSNIGQPIPSLSCYVLDEHGQPVGVGIAGELYVGGHGVSQGYLNRAELTSERFIASPFRNGDRLYRSGDRVRLLSSGELEYLGRSDEQLKIRGYRIEPGEIESVIGVYPGVQSVVVLGVEQQGGNRELVAYVSGLQEEERVALRSYLQERLPGYMVPSYIVLLEDMPLTVNGKVDRKNLPSIDGLDLAGSREYIAARTDVERKLVQIWSEVLNVTEETISMQDNFFELGGHSLKAIQLITKTNHAFSVNLSIQNLFAEGTIENMSGVIAFQQEQDTHRQNKDNLLDLDI